MDFRYAFRALVKSPGFAVSAVCILALGIALNTVVFTFYESVVWKPLPVRAPGEIVRVSGQHGQTPLELFSYAEYTQLRDANRSFVSAVATSEPQSLLAVLPGQSKEDALLVQARFVSGNYFPALGVVPVLGRAFEDGEPGVVVSHSLWQGRLRGDASAVGRTAAINGVPFAILGVAPESFAGTGLPPQEPDLWIPASA